MLVLGDAGCVLEHLCTTAVIAENWLHVGISFVIAKKESFSIS